MRAEVGEVPCTLRVTPVTPASAMLLAICELLRVWRTTAPRSSELPAVHGVLVAKATTNASAGDTLIAWTMARYLPAGPLRLPWTGEAPLHEACSTLLGSTIESVMKLPGEQSATLMGPPGELSADGMVWPVERGAP